MAESTSPAPGNRCVVVTGASSGIGKASAEIFARMGWHVIGTGRDAERCARAEADLRALAHDGGRVNFLRGDFTEMADVLRIAGEIATLTDRIDVLVNNAGGVRDALYPTSEGLEATFTANHLAPFLLTRELMPLLQRAAEDQAPGSVRIIAVSSLGHMACPAMNWDDLMMMDNFVPASAYCQAKLANLLFTRELNRRVEGLGIVAQAMHPGRVDSNFAAHGDEAMRSYMAANECSAPDQPARTIVWLATSPEAGQPGGRYFYDMAEAEPAPQAKDDEAAALLWAESERILQAVTAVSA